MAGRHFILIFLVQYFVSLHGAKILTVCFIGGSHFLLMDEISRVLHNNGHDVRMLLQIGDGLLPGYKMQDSPYQITSWQMDENYLNGFKSFFKDHEKVFFTSRDRIPDFFPFFVQMSLQCKMIFNQSSVINSLRDEKYDIAVIDALNPCSLLVTEKLGIPFIAFHPVMFSNAIKVGLPCPLSYVPLFWSQLTDRMTFLERVKNTIFFFASQLEGRKINAVFDNVIEEHFPAGSRPSLADLYLKAELWIYNIDFSIEFARPLLPHVQYIGGLLAKPAKPVSQELENFISQSGDTGFIVVALGSMISSYPLKELVKEMNDAFKQIPQHVIWRYQGSEWPKDLELAPNVKIMDWISQNDLLGHPKARLLVTHGGLNSLMEAVYHGVPVVGIPLFGDQFDNVVRIKAKKMGTFILPDHLNAESFANTIRHVTEDKSYKASAMHLSLIHRSHPFPPDQQLVRWVDHIIKVGGGDHLRPYAFQQPWYQQYLLDVILFISMCFFVACYLVVKLLRIFMGKLSSIGKQKQN
ncbi:UDP-glucuronosyltransferase 3A1-like [Rhinophrynus dorsalis]